MDKYNIYTVQDFLDDRDFLLHIKYPEHTDYLTLNEWIKSNPSNIKEYEEAKLYLIGILRLPRKLPTVDFTESLLIDVSERINKRERSRYLKQLSFRWAGVAASLLFVIGSVLWYYNSMISIHTGNGELRSVHLPDSSVVHLNANSSLSYYRAWSWRPKREVFMNGEALFNVKHLNQDSSMILSTEQFVVYTGDIVVEVLGTIFNIKNRDDQVDVSLLKGKVSLRDVHNDTSHKILYPGDIARFASHTFEVFTQKKQDLEQITTWTKKKVFAKNLSVEELITEFYYLYGRKIVITDTILLAKRIDGQISLATAESIIYSLANILQADVHLDGDTVYLVPKKN